MFLSFYWASTGDYMKNALPLPGFVGEKKINKKKKSLKENKRENKYK